MHSDIGAVLGGVSIKKLACPQCRHILPRLPYIDQADALRFPGCTRALSCAWLHAGSTAVPGVAMSIDESATTHLQEEFQAQLLSAMAELLQSVPAEDGDALLRCIIFHTGHVEQNTFLLRHMPGIFALVFDRMSQLPPGPLTCCKDGNTLF